MALTLVAATGIRHNRLPPTQQVFYEPELLATPFTAFGPNVDWHERHQKACSSSVPHGPCTSVTSLDVSCEYSSLHLTSATSAGESAKPASVSRYSYRTGLSWYLTRSKIPNFTKRRKRSVSTGRAIPRSSQKSSKRRIPRSPARTKRMDHLSPTTRSVSSIAAPGCCFRSIT